MLLVGFYAAWILAHWRAKQEGIDPQYIADLLIWCVLSGVTGARIAYVVIFRDQFSSVWEYLKVWEGGLVFYGGLAAGSVVVLGLLRHWKLPLGKMADIIAPSIALGLAFGRIGCFLYGCCWGQVCTDDCLLRPIAVSFPGKFVEAPNNGIVAEGSPAFMAQVQHGRIPLPAQLPAGKTDLDAKSLPVIPTQLIASGMALVLCIVLNLAYRFRRRHGEVFLLFGVLYPINRFILEALRDDNAPVLLGMTVSQVLSVVFFVFSAVMLLRGRIGLMARRRAG
jgi:phosphatidylglycerol:prolipoprotein diacylglycerol transferase